MRSSPAKLNFKPDCLYIQRAELKYEEDDRSDTEEEKPTVVVLGEGDLTADEVDQLKNIKDKEDKGKGHNSELDIDIIDDRKSKFY